jgi:hypothetical protein
MRSRFMNVSTRASMAFSLTTPPLDSRGSAASAMLSRTDSPGTMPSLLRSSGSIAMPALSALAVLLRLSGVPLTETSPASVGSAPAMARAVSDRPAPSSPPSPRPPPAGRPG